MHEWGRPSAVAHDGPTPCQGDRLKESFETVRRIAVGILMESLDMTDQVAMTLLVRPARGRTARYETSPKA